MPDTGRGQGTESHRTGVIDNDCELAGGCWELNSGPLEEEQGLLTAELTLQLQHPSLPLSGGWVGGVWWREARRPAGVGSSCQALW